MMISLRALLILLLLTFLAGLLILAPMAQWLQGMLNGIFNALSPIGSAVNATSDTSLCRHVEIGC